MKRPFSRWLGILNRLAVFGLLAVAVVNLFLPLFVVHYTKNPGLIQYFAMHRLIRRFLGILLLLICWKLYKRVSAAWLMAMVVLSFLLCQSMILQHEKVWNPLFIGELTCYFILLFSRHYYCRKMDRTSLKRALAVFFVYSAGVLFNAALGLFRERGTVSFFACIKATVGIMLGMDFAPGLLSHNALYHSFLFWFSWISILFGLALLLTPYINVKTQNEEDMERARALVLLYGQNCSSYLALEKDKSYFFGRAVSGVIAYGVVRDVLVVLGDPICPPEQIYAFLTEIRAFCRENAYNLLFLNTTPQFLPVYKTMGFGYVKGGEEPRFYLPEYSIAGGSGAKIRLNINHATRSGIRVLEYRPQAGRNAKLEKELKAVSQEWFSMKKSGELVFTMGGIGLENPMERRYFYGINQQNKIEGFIVFVPFAGQQGYMADVTRHSKGATRGVMEKIFYEAMMVFKEEGILWGSMAGAPLARMEKEPEVTARLLNMIYEKMNRVYGFKDLYQAKLKYNPTHWVPNYYVYAPPLFTPAMAYAIVRIQNPKGVLDYAKALFRNRFGHRQQAKDALPEEPNE